MTDRGITSLSAETSGARSPSDRREAARCSQSLRREFEVDFVPATAELSRRWPSRSTYSGDPSKARWLRVSLPSGDEYERVRAKVSGLGLHTVCQEAACPNLAECWGAGTATIMILGDMCTRGCRFCNVKTGNPRGEVDWLEPLRVAEAVRDLGWKYLVVTAVDRDDLADGGALIFANTVRAIHERVPGARSRSSPATIAATSRPSTS